MLLLTERLLEISMRMEKSPRVIVRSVGKLLGIFPVWYSSRLEKRLFEGKWDPGKKYRGRGHNGKGS